MENTAPQRDLIFDIGLHRGLDTDFYLQKGFRVVALEARADFCAEVKARLASHIEARRLTVVQHALWRTSGETIPFFINPDKDDWGSAVRESAVKGTDAVVEEIQVSTITLADLFDRHGVPYYLKCDIEGLDAVCAAQLLADGRRPRFVSMELTSFDILANLRSCGYDRAQLVNQAFTYMDPPPQPAREGSFVSVQFNGHMSGPFGRDLNPANWFDFNEISERYLDFARLKQRDERLALGWLDLHVTTSESIAEGCHAALPHQTGTQL